MSNIEKALEALKEAERLQEERVFKGLIHVDLYVKEIEGDWLEEWAAEWAEQD